MKSPLLCFLFCLTLPLFSTRQNNQLLIDLYTGSYYQYQSFALSLYSSQSFINYGCKGFYDFPCDFRTNCYLSGDSISADYLQFSASGPSCQLSAYDMQDNYEFQDGMRATSCPDMKLDFRGANGIVALGFADGNRQHFKGFVIILCVHLQTGYLKFYPSKEGYLTPPAGYGEPLIIPSDLNWRMNGTGTLSVADHHTILFLNVLFDVNSDAVGFPSNLFDIVMDNLLRNTSMSCSSDLYKPECFYSGSLSKLPNITITIHEQAISIPPQVYVQNYTFYGTEANGYLFYLNLKCIGNSLTGESYVTSNFSNYIILDQNVLDHYQVVFDALNAPIILLYPPIYDDPNPDPTPTPDPPNWTMILLVASAVVVIVGAAIFFLKRERRDAQREMAAAIAPAAATAYSDQRDESTNYANMR